MEPVVYVSDSLRGIREIRPTVKKHTVQVVTHMKVRTVGRTNEGGMLYAIVGPVELSDLENITGKK